MPEREREAELKESEYRYDLASRLLPFPIDLVMTEKT